MEWRDQGILLSVRRHGETSAIIEVFTPDQAVMRASCAAGPAARSRRSCNPARSWIVTWRARLEDHIGSFTVEPVRSRAAVAMADRRRWPG